jgi:putative membrane protein
MRRTTIAAVALTVLASLTLVAVAAARRSEPPDAVQVVAAQTLDDPTIVAIFDAANTADIETGELAMRRGQSEEVREFGAMLARDHKFVRQQGRDLAKKLGVIPTPPADDAGAKAHVAAMAKLRAVRDADFDHAFLQHEVAFHKSVIEAVKTTLLPAIRNAEVKDLVTKIAPAFQTHMKAAENLDKRLVGTEE